MMGMKGRRIGRGYGGRAAKGLGGVAKWKQGKVDEWDEKNNVSGGQKINKSNTYVSDETHRNIQ
jgi:hypothetical protein